MASKKRAPPEPVYFRDGTTVLVGQAAEDYRKAIQEAQANYKEESKPMSLKVNFARVATDFTPRSKGNYEGTLISHKMNAASASSGNPTVTLDWSENDSPNKHMFKTYSLQPKALWSLKRDLIRMGASVEDMNSEEADLDTIIEGLYGYVSTISFGDPRPYKDKEDNDKVGDNMLEVVDPTKN